MTRLALPSWPDRHNLSIAAIVHRKGSIGPSAILPEHMERDGLFEAGGPFDDDGFPPDLEVKRVLHELDLTHTPTLRAAAHDSATGQFLSWIKVGEAPIALNSDVTMFAISVAA